MDIDYHLFRNLYSTNTWALDNALLLSRNKLSVISADEQTAGRGRHTNKWASFPFKNVHATFSLFAPSHCSFANLPQILSLLAIEFMLEEGIPAKIKWPNDLYVNKKKIGGVLSETLDFGKERFIAMGLGLNVNIGKEEIEKLPIPATSFFLETQKEFRVPDIVKKLSLNFSTKIETFLSKGFSAFYDSFKRNVILNQEIYFKDNFRKLHKGKGIDIGEDGSFKMELENGDIKIFQSGELIERENP